MLRDYLGKINQAQPNLDAPWVTKSSSPSTGKTWRCVLIHALTGDENRGQHNVFVDVLDAAGKPYAPAVVPGVLAWKWEGQQPGELSSNVIFDKNPPEPLANIPINHGQVVTIWISSYIPSDVVGNLRTDFVGNPATGNSLYHNSCYVVFQMVDGFPAPPPARTIEQRIAALEASARAAGWQL